MPKAQKKTRHPRWGDTAAAFADATPGIRETWDGQINALDVYEPDGVGLIGSYWAAVGQDDVGGFVTAPGALREDGPVKWRSRIRLAYLEDGMTPQDYIDGWRSRGGNGITFEFGRYEEGTTLAALGAHLRALSPPRRR